MEAVMNLRALASMLVLALGSLPVLGLGSSELGPLATPRGGELGVQVSDYRYHEPALGVTLSGTRWGIQAAWTRHDGLDEPFGRLDLRYSQGNLKYEGSGTMTGVPDKLFETRLVFGRDYIKGHAYGLSPYVGLGYRYLYNDARGTSSTGRVGYRRYSHYFYLPVGLTTRFATRSQWVISPTVEADVFLQGRQKTCFSDVGPGRPDFNNSQESGFGCRARLMFERGRLAFGPWFQSWRVNCSDLTDIGSGVVAWEPSNRTREFGVELNYRF
jgi:hypothetical protein